MIFFVRSGPETIVFTFTGNFDKAEKILLGWGEYAGSDIEEAFSLSGEFSRIVIARIIKGPGQKEEVRVYISETCIQRLLCTMLNAGLGEGIAESRMQPGYILMRLLGDIEKGIERIKEDFGGDYVPNDPYFTEPLPEDSSVIYFTSEPLNHRIPHSKMHDRALYVTEHSKEKLLATLRMRQNEYLGDSMGTPDWNMMTQVNVWLTWISTSKAKRSAGRIEEKRAGFQRQNSEWPPERSCSKNLTSIHS